jgi:hypothetical protein
MRLTVRRCVLTRHKRESGAMRVSDAKARAEAVTASFCLFWIIGASMPPKR